MNTILREAARPWKLAVLAIGLAALFVGGRLMPAPDWSDGVSLAMGIPTYLLAGWSVNVIRDRKWRLLPLAIAAGWLCVDGVYTLWWSVADPWALEQMRAGQWQTSACLYSLMGMVLMHEGPLATLLRFER